MKSAIAIASIALSLGLHYFRTITYPSAKRRLEMHASIFDGTAPSQYRQRVLMPYLAEGIVKTAQPLLPQETDRPTRQGSQKAILLAYFLLETSAIFVGLFATFLLCGIWLEPPWPLLAALLEGAVMPLTFHDAFFHPWSQAEFGFFSVGLLLAARNRWRQLALLVALAALNRETSVFLVLAVFFVALPDRRRRRWAVACSAIWAVIFVGLRIVLGFPPPTFTIAMAIHGNLSAWRLQWSVVLNFAVLGGLWAFVAMGYRKSPEFLRRAAWSVPFYCGLLLVIGLWNEVRYWTAVFPILIPMAVCYLHDTTARPSSSGAPSLSPPSSSIPAIPAGLL